MATLPDGRHSDYDVIVVGGGPAGCAFTRSLLGRKPAVRSLLIDKSRFPRDKVCGDALTHHAIPVIRRVFPELAWLTPSGSFTAREVLRYPNGRCLVRDGRELDVIPRVTLDNSLWKATADAGAETLESARVMGVLTEGGRVRGVTVQQDGAERVLTCRLLVGADGSQSVVRRGTGRTDRDHVIHALRHYVRGVPETTNGLIFFFDLSNRGYFWIFPFARDGERWANVGYGNATDGRSLRERFWRYCEAPEVRRYLGTASFEGKLAGFPLNMARFTWRGRLSRPLWGPGYILLGDAASLIHPLSGEGISFAIESGRIAADVLLDARIRPVRKGRVYERRVLRHVRPLFLSVTAFCAIRLPMLLPRRLSDAYVDSAWHAQRILNSTLRRLTAPGAAAPVQLAEPGRIPPDSARAGRSLGWETGVLAALLGSLGLFWAAWLLGGRTIGSPYGLRAALFTGLAALFCLLHARRWHGPRFALGCFGVAFGSSLVAELVGTRTGLVFGAYHYSADVPGRMLGLVPVVVPFAWFVLSYVSYVTAAALCATRSASGAAPGGPVSRALVGAALLVAYDLVADPNHVYRGGWAYAGGGIYYGVPLQNFVAWYALGFASLLLIAAIEPRVGSSPVAGPDPSVALLGVVAYVGVLVHEGLFALLIAGNPGAGILALGVALGVCALRWPPADRTVKPSSMYGVARAQPPAPPRDAAERRVATSPPGHDGMDANRMGQAVWRSTRGAAESASTVLSKVRVWDVLVLQGPPIVGLALGWNASVRHSLWMLPVFLLASGLLVAHVFCLNDWSDVERDSRDVNKARHAVRTPRRRRDMAGVTLGLGALSLGLFSLLPWPTFVTALGVVLLSLLYSHPILGAKGIPILSSILHLTGGVLHFLLGYSLSGAIDRRGILVGVYFGVVFAAGHLTQEVGDYDADRLSGVRTNAVKFGKRRAFEAAFILFTVAYAIVVGLSHVDAVPRALMGLAVFYPIQAVCFWRAFRADLTFERVSAYRRQYRVLFALMGLVICTTLFVQGLRP